MKRTSEITLKRKRKITFLPTLFSVDSTNQLYILNFNKIIKLFFLWIYDMKITKI